MAKERELLGSSSLQGLTAHEQDEAGEDVSLTAKPHPFGGAVLSPKHARELTPALCLAIASSLSEQAFRKNAIPYTLWITEAWRVLGWAEPSAALFWEMATMYHTLYLAGRAFAEDFKEDSLAHIPPILSCGSASSVGSGNALSHGSNVPNDNQAGLHSASSTKKKFSTAASAKELPVWLVGSFLLLHCEESAISRSLSAEDERRFAYGTTTAVEPYQGKVDFTSLLQHPSLSPRTRMHAGWYNDNAHITFHLLRHLRKLLLLSAVSHNPDAVRACIHLSAIPPPVPLEKGRRSSVTATAQTQEILRQHEEEHGKVGMNVRLTMSDIERLHFWLQPPSGGGVDDPPLQLGEYLWRRLHGSSTTIPSEASIPLGEVEREIRRNLEMDLLASDDDKVSNPDSKGTSPTKDDSVATSLSKLSLSDSSQDGTSSEKTQRAKQPQQGYQKELSYNRLRGTTILLKPNSHYSETGPSSGGSTASGDPGFAALSSSTGRLHDLVISECSDAHMYLLQPFEHVTIAACTGCTIVVGAVAGLLHVVDCEKTTITSAARRILVSNSFDVLQCVFTPSPPLLVGDNRNCQFAPYNTYYDGLREDLLATGLAAVVVPEHLSPYQGNKSADVDVAWPPLQCASNKWKTPVEMSKLEMPQAHPPGGASPGVSAPPTSGAPSSPGADDKAAIDSPMHTPVLLPASEFHVLFVPVESDSSKQRRVELEEQRAALESSGETPPLASQYCRLLAEVMQLSPFHLPVEYERHALAKADRMRSLQQAVQKNLTEEQQRRFEEELNRGFRDWLVTSGNLRQVLDLVHLEKRAGA